MSLARTAAFDTLNCGNHKILTKFSCELFVLCLEIDSNPENLLKMFSAYPLILHVSGKDALKSLVKVHFKRRIIF